MSFTPISNTPPQYEENGIAASGYYIKFYESGTSTPTAMATDSTGATLLDKCQLNTEGYPINGSGAVFIPHINVEYKIALFRSEADANANDLNNAAWDVDNLIPGLSGVVGTDFNQIPLNADIVYPVANVAALRALTGVSVGQAFYLEGHAVDGVGGGNLKATRGHTTEIDNNGTLFVVDGAVIERELSGYTTPEMFGAVGSGDETAKIQAAGEAFEKVIISRSHTANAITLANKNIEFEFSGAGKITGDSVSSAIFNLSNCNSVFIDPSLDGAGLSKRGISQNGGQLVVRGNTNKIENFTSDSDFAAGVLGVNLTKLVVNGCNIENIIGTPNAVIGDPAGASRGVYAQSCLGVHIDDNTILDISGEEGDSIHVASGCPDSYVGVNNITGFTRRGVKVQSENAKVQGNNIKENATNATSTGPIAGIEIVSGDGAMVNNNTVNTPTTPSCIQLGGDNNSADNNIVTSGPNDAGSGGLLLRQRAIIATGENPKITNNKAESGFYVIESRKGGTIHGNTSIDGESKAYVIGLSGSPSSGVSFSGNTVKTTDANRFSASPILISDHDNGSFSGTIFESFDGLTNNTFTLSGSTGNNFAGTVSNQEFGLLGGTTTSNYIDGALESSIVFDFPSVADGGQQTTTATVTGAAIGDYVEVSSGTSLLGLQLSGYVSSSNTVTLLVSNSTGSAVDLGNATYRVRVRPA